MNKSKVIYMAFIVFSFVLISASYAETLKIGIMQDKPGVARKYLPLIQYFKINGIDASLQGYRNYNSAALSFKSGKIDIMFAGSGVAGSMMIKELAYPLVRPVTKGGWSTYWAVVIAPKGSPKFTGDKSFFEGKTILCTALASSGEFFARSILGTTRELMKTVSHGAAISALSRGVADVAIVKNRVWDSEQAKYTSLEQVGKDGGENPNGTLIVSNKTNKELVKKVKEILLGIENDNSTESKAVKETLAIIKYIPATEDDFSHTLSLLRQAGVTKTFNFKF